VPCGGLTLPGSEAADSRRPFQNPSEPSMRVRRLPPLRAHARPASELAGEHPRLTPRTLAQEGRHGTLVRLVGLRRGPPGLRALAVANVAACEDPPFRGWARRLECSLDPADLGAPARRCLVLRLELAFELPLLGLSKESPLRRFDRQGVHSRKPAPVARCPLPRDGTASSIRVPASWSSTTSPVSSSLPTRVYCNALPTLGFTAFPPAPPAALTLASRSIVRHRASPRCVPALRSLPSVHSDLPTLADRTGGTSSPPRRSPDGTFTDLLALPPFGAA